MPPQPLTLFTLAQRYVGVAVEQPGTVHHPLIQWWLSLCGLGLTSPDETPWCSAFVNGMAWELRLPRSKSAAARSWLTVGTPIPLTEATPEWDVVILTRAGATLDPTVLNAPGHVGIFAGREGDRVLLLGGNQGNNISIRAFPVADILGVRALA